MSNQSGISVSPSLADEFPAFVDSPDVAAVLNIDHAKEHVVLSSRVRGELEDVQRHLHGQRNNGKLEASYVVLRLPEEQNSFAFVQFMPDEAPLSSKMKYASSHATIHRQLGGSSLFATTIFWTSLDEVSHKGLKAHKDHEEAPAPMTEEESSLASAVRSQGTSGTSVAGQSTLAISANVTDLASSSLHSKLEEGSALIFRVNADDNESIDLVDTLLLKNVAPLFEGLHEPRYVVAKLKNRVLFAVTCPRQATIKQRMLFASTRTSFLEYLKTFLSVDVQIETFEPEIDLKLSALEAEVGGNDDQENSSESSNTSSLAAKPMFSRPRKPKRK